LLGDRLDLYQIHSVTPASSALRDGELHRRLADLAERGVVVGLSTSGPAQAEVIRSALRVRVDGQPVFRSVQATWNLLEPSVGPALAEAHDAGCLVIVKEALANGRLAIREGVGDTVALAAALHWPWAGIVLSGAATADQLASNLRAETLTVDPARWRDLAVPGTRYWQERSQLPWT
jgi:aryl-alcohol dehydrogenase-like predicted oxidoreductase